MNCEECAFNERLKIANNQQCVIQALATLNKSINNNREARVDVFPNFACPINYLEIGMKRVGSKQMEELKQILQRYLKK